MCSVSWRWALLSLLLVAVHAVLDKYHQAFTQYRTSSVADSMLDMAGGLIVLTLLWLRSQRRKTAKPLPLLCVAVVNENLAEVYAIAQALHAHGWQYVLQVLENRQRALHFFDRLATQDAMRCPDLLLLDFSFLGLDTRGLLQWITAMPVCRRLRIIVTTGSDDPAVQQEALALGADFFQKPVSFQSFMALGDLINAVVFGHTQA